MKIKVLVFTIQFILILFILSCNSVSNNESTKKNISLILKVNSGHYWGTIKLGADMAAKEYNSNLDINAGSIDTDIEHQKFLLNQAIDKNVDCIILDAIDFDELLESIKKAYSKNIPILLLDNEVDSPYITSTINSSKDSGIKAGEFILSTWKESCNMGIINFSRKDKSALARENGLYSEIKKNLKINVVGLEYLSDSNQSYLYTNNLIQRNPELNLIVALNDAVAEGAAQAILEKKLTGIVNLVSFDASSLEIKYLENSIINATIIQYPFNIGYLAVKYAIEKSEGKDIDKSYTIGSKIITKENMYLQENQKLLFPFIK